MKNDGTSRLRCSDCGAIFHADSTNLAPEGCSHCGSLLAFPAPRLPRGFAYYQPEADALGCASDLIEAIDAWKREQPVGDDGTDIDAELRGLIAAFTEPATPPLARASESIRPGMRGIAG
jgi:hypothetical protein